jgi:hypothetical protein
LQQVRINLENRKQLPGSLGPNSIENKHRPTGSQVAPVAHGLGQLGYGLSTLQPSGTVPPWCCATHMGHTGACTHGGCRPAGEPTDGAGRDQPRHAEDMAVRLHLTASRRGGGHGSRHGSPKWLRREATMGWLLTGQRRRR